MYLLVDLIGMDDVQLRWYQMAVRGLIVFVVALLSIRLSGMRTFGTQSAFDVVVAITLGGMFSGAIIGRYPFFPAILACGIFAALHRLVSYLASRVKWIHRIVVKKPVLLFSEGKFHTDNLKRNFITMTELEAALHEHKLEKFDEARVIRLEHDGRISVTRLNK